MPSRKRCRQRRRRACAVIIAAVSCCSRRAAACPAAAADGRAARGRSRASHCSRVGEVDRARTPRAGNRRRAVPRGKRRMSSAATPRAAGAGPSTGAAMHVRRRSHRVCVRVDCVVVDRCDSCRAMRQRAEAADAPAAAMRAGGGSAASESARRRGGVSGDARPRRQRQRSPICGAGSLRPGAPRRLRCRPATVLVVEPFAAASCRRRRPASSAGCACLPVSDGACPDASGRSCPPPDSSDGARASARRRSGAGLRPHCSSLIRALMACVPRLRRRRGGNRSPLRRRRRDIRRPSTPRAAAAQRVPQERAEHDRILEPLGLVDGHDLHQVSVGFEPQLRDLVVARRRAAAPAASAAARPARAGALPACVQQFGQVQQVGQAPFAVGRTSMRAADVLVGSSSRSIKPMPRCCQHLAIAR